MRILLLALSPLLASGCTRCGTYSFSSADGVVDGAIKQCGPLTGSFGDDLGTSVRLELVPTALDSATDDALLDLTPEILVQLPAAALAPQTTTGADDLYGTASAFVAAEGTRVVAPLVSGQVVAHRQTGQSLAGEPRWELSWTLHFEGEALTVDAEGGDRIDMVADTINAL